MGRISLIISNSDGQAFYLRLPDPKVPKVQTQIGISYSCISFGFDVNISLWEEKMEGDYDNRIY